MEITKKRSPIKQLSENCRCKCSSVCTISGVESIKDGKTKTYTLDVLLVRNSGCKQSTSDCKFASTTWTVGGTLKAAITLKDEKKKSVKVKVKKETKKGTFTLKAQPNYSCKCKGTDEVRVCQNQFDEVTIKVTN
ncbi:hypothetical protein [uncultured Lutibacter sp.]|uniref:hypothetical protein n=1 Tax=uncultured Lutibacter sp. TaxID=437739 RepID=UPI0026156006|nr:hypothetical protein [uncultured Lutibacter sp.]